MAAVPKKFGAFSGVFTPSILTILGVIMYLRLGWVAGVAGLTGIIAIILLAHVISFTTGLSISSIATDKKIKAGGLYYILSRSLGLPMGGSIGITLFIGTALSISLYIIGFTESFLSIPSIRSWIETIGFVPDSLNTTRVIGSAVLLILVIIAFISTDIAIKTQFLILGAIALSLLSVFVGFFIHPDLAPVANSVNISPFKNFSFEVVFAVFFPAVTGFTAGVAMSGDLKDPKSDIPKGTLWAIIIGFIIYLLLGISFALFIDKSILINDYNFLLRLAWIPVLVIAGIWGATLSSALGGILGGPRILQAVANDHIVPRLFSKGHGISNEPRNALILTFILSELGILIGDLNIIASIVTMFYLTAYGFINLAFALEKWASSDFRPSFNVPVWVGILGFIASFMLMFKLDMVSMFAALLILGAIYYYINRKHSHRPMSSVWQSVNISLVRNILNKLDQQKPDERDWRPNILLFSGGTKNRPHLIEFGKALVAHQGMISNFDLILNTSSKVLFPKHKQIVSDTDTESNQGIFSRRQECNNIYEGIETIASVYGFSGVEPNTVLLGWIHNSNEPKRFVSMLDRLVKLDLNIAILDYDKERGFGEYSIIDVWWRGGSNNGNFILSLIKFIISTYEWRNARVRVMIVNPKNENKSWIERDARSVLSNMRIEAEIRIINNEIDKRSIYEIIKHESINSDLVFLGIPDIIIGKESQFIEATNKLCNDIGTTILVKASSMFKELHIGFVPDLPNLKQETGTQPAAIKVPALAKSTSAFTNEEMGKYYGLIITAINKILKQHLDPIISLNSRLLDNIEETWKSFYNNIHQKIEKQDGDLRVFITNQNMRLVFKTKKVRKNFYKNDYPVIKEHIDYLTNALADVKEKILTLLPDEFTLKLSPLEIKELVNSGKLTPGEAALLELNNEFIIPFKKIKTHVLLADLAPSWLLMLSELGYSAFTFEIQLSKLNDLIEEYQMGKYYSNIYFKKIIATLEKKETSFTKLIDELRQQNKINRNIVGNSLLAGVTRSFNKSIALVETPDRWKKHPKRSSLKVMKKAETQLLLFSELWEANQKIISNTRTISWQLMAFKLRLRSLLINDITILNNYFTEYSNTILKSTKRKLKKLKTSAEANKSLKPIKPDAFVDYEPNILEIFDCNKKIINNLLKTLPEKVTLFSDEKFQHFKNHQFDLHDNNTIELSKLIDFIINNNLLKSLKNLFITASKQQKDNYSELDELVNHINSIINNNTDNKITDFDKALSNLDEIIEKNNLYREQIELRITERLNSTWDKISLSSLSIHNDMLQTFMREDISYKRKNQILNKIHKLKTFFR